MIIKHVKVRNYKTYLDLDLDLSVLPDRPIILIGGMNGGGKTTLFDAICGALYGLKINDEQHFTELLNNGAIGKVRPMIELELTFTGMVLDAEQKYILKRSYILNPAGKPVESVTLNMNGNQFSYGTASPPGKRVESEQQVSKIIKANLPQELSKYFLFDAMQSSELLKENVFAQIIKDNIQNVMGFNKYLQLRNASEHVQQEWAARRLAAEQEAQEYNALCEKKNALQEEQSLNAKEQEDLYKYLVTIQDEYNAAKEGAKSAVETQRKIDDLLQSIRETQNLSKRYNTQLKSFIASIETNVFFPHLATEIENEVRAIVRRKDTLKQENKEILTPAQLREITGKILSYLKSKLLCPTDVEDEPIVDYLLTRQEQLVGEDEYGFLDETELDALKELLGSNSVNDFVQLNELRYDVEKRLENYDNQIMQVDVLRKSQSSGNAEIIKSYDDCSKSLESLKKEAENRQAEIDALEKKIHKFDVQIQQEPDVKFDTLVKLKPFFDDVADTLLKKKKTKIEEDMKQQLNKLLISYKNCIAKVELSDSMKNFYIKLYHKTGNKISLNQLNAASKHRSSSGIPALELLIGDYEVK